MQSSCLQVARITHTHTHFLQCAHYYLSVSHSVSQSVTHSLPLQFVPLENHIPFNSHILPASNSAFACVSDPFHTGCAAISGASATTERDSISYPAAATEGTSELISL